MGRFSGEYDLQDIIEVVGGFEKFKGTKLFIGDKEHPLTYNSLKDLIPYYPYVEISGFHDNLNPRNSSIVLTKKSIIDLREEKYGFCKHYDELRNALRSYIEIYEREEK